MNPSTCLRSLIVIFLLSFAGPASAQLTFQIQDLGVLGGSRSIGAGVNDNGTAIGLSSTAATETPHPFYWLNATDGPQQIGTVPGDPDALNNANIVVGGIDYPPASTSYRAPFRYDIATDSLTYLGLADGTVVEGEGYGINSSNTIVGQFEDAASGRKRAFIWENATTGVTSLGTATGNGDSRAEDINDAGIIVGQSQVNVNGGTAPHAVMYDSGAAGDPWTDLGTLNADDSGLSLARAVNSAGKIVGASDFGPVNPNAFIYANGAMTPLASVSNQFSEAWDINDNDFIVGNFGDASGESQAALWLPDGGTYSLFSLHSLIAAADQPLWYLDLAVGINDLNQIIGSGYQIVNGQLGQRRAVLLTPDEIVSPPGTPGVVPEPATLLLVAGGLGSLALRRRKS